MSPTEATPLAPLECCAVGVAILAGSAGGVEVEEAHKRMPTTNWVAGIEQAVGW